MKVELTTVEAYRVLAVIEDWLLEHKHEEKIVEDELLDAEEAINNALRAEEDK